MNLSETMAELRLTSEERDLIANFVRIIRGERLSASVTANYSEVLQTLWDQAWSVQRMNEEHGVKVSTVAAHLDIAASFVLAAAHDINKAGGRYSAFSKTLRSARPKGRA